MTVTQIVPADLFGEEWHDCEHGRELSCSSLRTLTSYLFSAGARRVVISSLSMTGIPSAKIRVIGPVCDNGYPLYVVYHVNRGQFSRLSSKDKQQFVNRLKELTEYKTLSHRVYAVLGISK